MDITSKDCVKFITEHLIPSLELNNPKNWARIEKKKIDGCIIRVFKNKITGLEIEVIEKEGAIKRDLVVFNNKRLTRKILLLNDPEEKWEGDKILFLLTKDNIHDLDYDVYQLFVTGESYYKRYKCCDDSINTEPMCDLLHENGFECGEFIEGGIEFYKDTNIEALKKYLRNSKVFTINDDFQKWLGSGFGSDGTPIYITKEE